jgi:galactokinase
LQRHELPRADIVGACREAENSFVGVPCGVLDQGVSGFGKRESLVHIDCRGPSFSTVEMPGGVRFWVFNTHKKHALLDSLYSTRHAECMSAVASLKKVYPRIACLADISPAELEAAKRELAPDEFKRAKHVVEEIARVNAFLGALERKDMKNAGALLFASHKSSQLLFENSTDELDFLVEHLQGTDGVYGARLTGGGFGGAVMAMTDHEFSPENADVVADAYAKRFGNRPDCLVCATDDGASVV